MEVAGQDAALTTGRTDKAEQHADGGGLAGAIRAHEAAYRSAGDREVETVDHLAIAKHLRQTRCEHGHRGRIDRHETQGFPTASMGRNLGIRTLFVDLRWDDFSRILTHPFGEYQCLTEPRDNEA